VLYGHVQVQRDPDPEEVYSGPLLVLTSVLSASASEILAGAIQDYNRGLIVGARTHGKGTVQNLVSLDTPLVIAMRRVPDHDEAGSLKITTFKFYRVSGGSTQHKGVEPDIVLPSPFDAYELGEDQLDYALTWDHIDPVEHKNYSLDRSLIPALAKASQERVGNDPEFKYLKKDLEYLEAHRNDKVISLNFETREKEKKALDSEDEQREKERKERNPESEETTGSEPKDSAAELDKDYILQESLNILGDYLFSHTSSHTEK
jgi:carboxyl-terminal processing protease